jgi:hypothetical protein
VTFASKAIELSAGEFARQVGVTLKLPSSVSSFDELAKAIWALPQSKIAAFPQELVSELGIGRAITGNPNEKWSKLAAIIKLEESHSQWWKWLINISLIAYLIMMNLALPTSSRPSPIGIQKCSISYWCLYVSFLFFCGLMLVLTIKLLSEE